MRKHGGGSGQERRAGCRALRALRPGPHEPSAIDLVAPTGSSHPLDGGDGRGPGMLGGLKAMDIDIDGNPAIQP